MSDANWKAEERAVARMFNTQRALMKGTEEKSDKPWKAEGRWMAHYGRQDEGGVQCELSRFFGHGIGPSH